MKDTRMENNSTPQATSQFVLSYELLSLLQWMVEHDAYKLKKIIAQSLNAGLRHQIKRTNYQDSHSLESAQYTIVEFFGVLETIMLETMQEQSIASVVEKNLIPALDRIDTKYCDENSVRLSIEKAIDSFETNPHSNPQEVLFKELLRRSRPGKKSRAH